MLLVVLASAPAASAASGSFTGLWRATDPSDGSTLVLAISPTGRMLLFDDRASSCDGGGFAFAFGPGSAAGSTFSATVDVFCGATPFVPFAEDVVVTFELVGTTLVGEGGEVYHRLGSH